MRHTRSRSKALAAATAESALPVIVLQQAPRPGDGQRLACALLRASKGLAAQLQEALHGQLAVQRAGGCIRYVWDDAAFRLVRACGGGDDEELLDAADDVAEYEAAMEQRSAAFGAWLAHHAALVRSLDVSLNRLPPPEPPPGSGCCGCCDDCGQCTFDNHGADDVRPRAAASDEAGVAEALAGAGGSLRLRELRLSPPSRRVLAALGTCTSLTRLELAADDGEALAVGAAAPALAALRGLRELHLCATPRPGTTRRGLDALTAGVSGLTALTRLCVARATAEALGHLPSSLRALDVQLVETRALAAPLALGHLSALTSLRLAPDDGPSRAFLLLGGLMLPVFEMARPALLRGGEALPPSLRELSVAGCGAAEPLLALTALRSLALADCSLDAAGVAALSRLGQLSHLSLAFAPAPAAPSAPAAHGPGAAATASAPAGDGAGCGGVAGVVEAVAGLRQLRSLLLAGAAVPAATRSQLGAVSRLSRLELD